MLTCACTASSVALVHQGRPDAEFPPPVRMFVIIQQVQTSVPLRRLPWAPSTNASALLPCCMGPLQQGAALQGTSCASLYWQPAFADALARHDSYCLLVATLCVCVEYLCARSAVKGIC